MTPVLPRRERAHRCCAVVTEYCRGGTLRDAVARGDLSLRPPGSSGGSSGAGQHLIAAAGGAAAAGAPAAAAAAGAGAALAAPPVLSHVPDLALLRGVLLQVAQGAHFLHSRRVVHGELRADNVLLTGSLAGAGPAALAAARAAHAAAAAAAASAAAEGDCVGGADHDDDGDAAAAGGGASSTPAVSRAMLEAASALPGGVRARLKDVALCTLSVSNRTLALRKLAGRARLHAVGWLPPECFRGEGLGRAADVYAFGILMWEALTGQVAFHGFLSAPARTLQAVITDGARPGFPEGTPRWYSELAARCWAPAPKARPSFRRVAAALAAVPPDQLVWGARPAAAAAGPAAWPHGGSAGGGGGGNAGGGRASDEGGGGGGAVRLRSVGDGRVEVVGDERRWQQEQEQQQRRQQQRR